jgi:hypothetical protein
VKGKGHPEPGAKNKGATYQQITSTLAWGSMKKDLVE